MQSAIDHLESVRARRIEAFATAARRKKAGVAAARAAMKQATVAALKAECTPPPKRRARAIEVEAPAVSLFGG
ncbi:MULTISPECIES: hypothetical protein [unclassified Chelatococcus]|uniref:hypothetical protein n=1 Tax=unclassified Chelatococcus TaxID=2638111 RepID=UPI001BD0C120|nr:MULTISPECIES: hypothetical protein [unclassified Chelatococcus]CAH1670500.1 hypothetical protein CHELA41_23401 [Hyphomicrobiales bacterium]MBS7738345.1 hypothetical protein [Chelatococcus sp. HY11]MBX3545873.1 hypothetical protein [Chelatococcus sp.]MCO5077309.1 hypothetical protein [Chelatococcus sp.]CAH1677268.1 hypothetical protein CHELA20_51611 [Hyphomicrobiales bacterium]